MNLSHGSTWALLYLLSEWAIRIAMLVVVPVRRSPEAAKGWLLLAFSCLGQLSHSMPSLAGRLTRAGAASGPPAFRPSSS